MFFGISSAVGLMHADILWIYVEYSFHMPPKELNGPKLCFQFYTEANQDAMTKNVAFSIIHCISEVCLTRSTASRGDYDAS